MDVLAFRFFNVFGLLQPAGHAYAAVVPAFVSAALEGRPVPVHGAGDQTRDFTYVGSVVSVLTDALARRVTAVESVNLAFGSRTSLLGLIAVLEEVLGRPLERQHGDPRAGTFGTRRPTPLGCARFSPTWSRCRWPRASKPRWPGSGPTPLTRSA